MKAFEKIINSIMEYARLNLSGVELETIEKAAKNGHAGKSVFSSSPLAEAVAEARAEIFRQESKNCGRSRILSAVKRIFSISELEKFAGGWTGKDGRQYFCSGFHGVALKNHLSVSECEGLENIESVVAPENLPENYIFLDIPDRATVSGHIKTEKATRKRGQKNGVVWDFGEGKPIVNASYLLDMLDALPGATAYFSGNKPEISPIYFRGDDGDGVLLPVRPDKYAREVTAERYANTNVNAPAETEEAAEDASGNGGKETEVSRDHAENQEPEEKDAANESEIVATVPEMSTKTIRFYYNGLKANGGKLVRAFYHIESGQESPYVSISVRDYSGSLPRDCFVVKNDSDPYMDYYDTDRATITPEHPLYPYARAAAIKAATRKEPEYITELEKGLDAPERWPGRHEALRNDIASRRARYEKLIKELETLPKGNPTTDDLHRVALMRQEEETERLRAEHEKQLQERERMLNIRNNGREYIKGISAEYPVEDGEPHVVIEWSEYPAFYSWDDGELSLSVAAAEIIFAHFDRDVCKEKAERGEGGYYKTKFTIHYTGENGEPHTYEGRYDLGDNDGGMIQHIRSFGEYWKEKGKNDDDKQGGAEIIDFANAMQQHTAAGAEVKVDFAPWIKEAARRREEVKNDIFTAVKMLTDDQIVSAVAMQDPKNDKQRDIAKFFIQELYQRDKQKALNVFQEWENGNLDKYEEGAI